MVRERQAVLYRMCPTTLSMRWLMYGILYRHLSKNPGATWDSDIYKILKRDCTKDRAYSIFYSPATVCLLHACEKAVFVDSQIHKENIWCGNTSGVLLFPGIPVYNTVTCGNNRNWINPSLPWQNGRHFAHGIFKCIFINDKLYTSIRILRKLVSEGPIDNGSVLVQKWLGTEQVINHYLEHSWLY